LPIDNSQIEINKQEWMKANNKDSTSMGRRRGGGPKKTPEAWRDPEPHENNKRIIYGKPYTWNGRSSWILDKTPDSGLPETPLGTNKLADVPSTIQPPTDKGTVGDDGTVMSNDTGWTLENRNEIRRIQANLQNLGANLAAVLKQE
jgi:hypothetical protein